MVPGFVLDQGGLEIFSAQQTWVEGEPEESIWTGLKTSNRDTYAVAAFRCGICGRLEFYTTDRVKI